jgi:hypothetical protein
VTGADAKGLLTGGVADAEVRFALLWLNCGRGPGSVPNGGGGAAEAGIELKPLMDGGGRGPRDELA